MSSLQSWEQDEAEKAGIMTIFGHLADLAEARATAIRRYGILSWWGQTTQTIFALKVIQRR